MSCMTFVYCVRAGWNSYVEMKDQVERTTTPFTSFQQDFKIARGKFRLNFVRIFRMDTMFVYVLLFLKFLLTFFMPLISSYENAFSRIQFLKFTPNSPITIPKYFTRKGTNNFSCCDQNSSPLNGSCLFVEWNYFMAIWYLVHCTCKVQL